MKLVFPDLHFMTIAETVQLHAHIKMYELFEQQELTEIGVIMQLLSTHDEHTKRNTVDRWSSDCKKKMQLDCFLLRFVVITDVQASSQSLHCSRAQLNKEHYNQRH